MIMLLAESHFRTSELNNFKEVDAFKMWSMVARKSATNSAITVDDSAHVGPCRFGSRLGRVIALFQVHVNSF
jgi:hypothetical protein